MSDLGVWGKPTSPYHKGEMALHERYGRLQQQTMIGRQVHSPVMDAHQAGFLSEREYVVVGSIDSDGRPWASIVFGEAGFAQALDPSTVNLGAAPLEGDRLNNNMVSGAPMSIVAIDLATRRRIRANVTFTSADDNGLRLHIDQAYGNCPKYIQTRELVQADGKADHPAAKVETFTSLTDRAREIIGAADTFFVASHNPEDDQHDVGGVDVNHRGGRAGFVRIDDNTLVVPDYMGNFAFNTLGNFLLNPVAGLLFVDFETGDILQLTGTTEILWDDDPELERIKGARRAWKFHLEEASLIHQATSARFAFGEYSPSSLRTGTWDAE